MDGCEEDEEISCTIDPPPPLLEYYYHVLSRGADCETCRGGLTSRSQPARTSVIDFERKKERKKNVLSESCSKDDLWLSSFFLPNELLPFIIINSKKNH